MTYEPRHLGIVSIPEQVLGQLLQLPKGYRVVSVRGNWEFLSVDVLIEGPGLPEHTPATEPVRLFTKQEVVMAPYETPYGEGSRVELVRLSVELPEI